MGRPSRSSATPLDVRSTIRGLLIAVPASAAVFAAVAAYGDVARVTELLRTFPLSTALAVLALSTGCYLIRAFRWGRLMHLAGFDVRFRDAAYLQFSGHAMAVTPGKVGELLKPWLARVLVGMPMTRGVALVFSERVADLLGVALLSLGGLTLLEGARWWVVLGALALVGGGAALASSARFHAAVLAMLEKREWTRKHRHSAAALSETVRLTLQWRTLLWSAPLSALAWGLEGVGLALCLRVLGVTSLDVWPVVSVYAVSSIAGALSFFPGGIGLTEVSMTGILVAVGADASAASAATLVTRVATLWWGVLLGFAVLSTRPRLFREAAFPEDEPEGSFETRPSASSAGQD